MDEKVRNELGKYVSVLAATGIVSRIYLFGSHARGEGSGDSDIDLCVLTPVKDRRPIEIGIELRLGLRPVKTMPLDLVVYNEEDFYFHAQRPTSFHREIVETGVMLYGNG